MSTPYQPAYPGQPGGEPPPSNLVWGILTVVLCGGGVVGLVAGIISIVNATQVSGKWAVGDYAGAHESSSKAKKWALWGFVISAVLFLLIVGVVVALGASGAFDNAATAP